MPRRTLFSLTVRATCRRRVWNLPPVRHSFSATSSNVRRAPIAPTAIFVLVIAAGACYQSLRESPDTDELNPVSFTPFTIVDKQPVSSTASIFTLRPKAPQDGSAYAELWQKGTWSVEFMQPQLQIARSYTPLPPTGPASDDLRFLIRREGGGEMSNYIHRLAIGDDIHLRGPHIEYAIPDDVSDMVFVAGGTGIAPAMQAAYTLTTRPTPSRVVILWANRRREDCRGAVPEAASWFFWRRDETPGETGILVDELYQLTTSGQVSVKYFVDEVSAIRKPHLEAAIAPTHEPRVIAVSGPDGFISHFAGPKVWADGREQQGPLGGLLSLMKLQNTEVVKL